MSYFKKQIKHDSGLTVSDMNGLAVLLLQAFKGSIQQELEETGQVNPRLLAEAVRWLSQSGVQLSPDSASVVDLSSLVSSFDAILDEKERQV